MAIQRAPPQAGRSGNPPGRKRLQRPGVGAKLIAAAVALALAAREPAVAGPAGEATLGSAANFAGRYFGAALDPDALGEQPYRELAARQLTSITPENAMKWGLVEPERGRFDWEGADALVAFAKANGQRIRGHTLVWHSQLPPWLINGSFRPDEVKDLMVAHISEEAGRYKRAIYAWDVVNEPGGEEADPLRIRPDQVGQERLGVPDRVAQAVHPVEPGSLVNCPRQHGHRVAVAEQVGVRAYLGACPWPAPGTTGIVRRPRKIPPMPRVSPIVWRTPYLAGMSKSARVAL